MPAQYVRLIVFMEPATRYTIISGVLIVSLTSLAALVAIWSALSRRNRLLRAAVFFALPGALMYAQAAEPAIGLFVAMLTICGAMLLVRWVRHVPGASNERARRKLQFHFRDVLFAISLIGVVLAGLLRAQKQLLDQQIDFSSFSRINYLALLHCAGLAVVSLAAAWLAFGAKRLWLRTGVLAASVALVHLSMRGLAGFTEIEFSGITFGMFLLMPREGVYELSSLAVLGAHATMVFLYLCLWRRATANTSPTATKRYGGAAVAVGALSLIVPVPAAYLYYALVRPIPIPSDDVPSPNGWDQLIDAGRAVQCPPGVILGMEMPGQLASVVQRNQKVYADARQALAIPSRVRVSYTKFSFEHTQCFRDLTRAFDALGKFHTHNAEWNEALQTYQDVLRLADRTENGGLIIDMLVADAIAGTALERLEGFVPKLTAAQSRALIRDLLDFDRQHEPLAVIVARDEIADRLSGGWAGRWNACIESLKSTSNHSQFAVVRRRISAETHVLLCDLAVHAYWLDHGNLPRDAGELARGYLKEIPLDPWDDKPIKFVFRDGEYLVYSVGPNGRDDGGQPERYTGDWPVTQRKLAEAKK